MKRGIVYTVITNGKNNLNKHYNNPNWDFWCFTDNPKSIEKRKDWVPVHLKCPDLPSRRCTKVPKILSHRYVAEYEYSIYIDGTTELITDPEKLVSILDDNCMALFSHHLRNCIYDEAKAVISQHRDDVRLVEKTVKMYRQEKYPPKNGLIDSKVIVRRHTSNSKKFNEAWWNVYKQYSQRDQLSFNYISWKEKIPYSVIPGNPYKENTYIKFHQHLKPGLETDNLRRDENN